MCKIFAMTNVSRVKITTDLINVVRDALCKHNDRDGFGYAINTVGGNLWGEKTTAPFQFEPLNYRQSSVTQNLPIVEIENQSFGEISEDNQSFIAHGRMSTNVINIGTTHPFLSDNVALIHNGVVSDPWKEAGRLTTGCDTEILLNLWERNGMDCIEENAAGYYALAILDKLGQLHIARDDRANLFIAWSETVNSYLIATTVEILQSIADRMQWIIEVPEKIVDNVYAVFKGNEVISYKEISPVGFDTGVNEDLVSRALGYGDSVTEIETEVSELNDDDCPSYHEDYDSLDYIGRRKVG